MPVQAPARVLAPAPQLGGVGDAERVREAPAQPAVDADRALLPGVHRRDSGRPLDRGVGPAGQLAGGGSSQPPTSSSCSARARAFQACAAASAAASGRPSPS